MRTRISVTLVIGLSLSGCAQHEGLYSPSCAAYTGSQIALKDGRFVWTKFTDEVIVDDDGNKVDQFPGYPLRGEYNKKRQKIILNIEDGGQSETMYLSEFEGALYLHTADEFDRFEKTGERPECALRLQGAASEN